MSGEIKFVIVCFENLPEEEIPFVRNLLKEFESDGIECIAYDKLSPSWKDALTLLQGQGYELKDGLIIVSKETFDTNLIHSGLTIVVYDEGEGKKLPYDIDLVVSGFEEIDSVFLIKLWCHKNGFPCTIAITDRTIIRELCRDDIEEVIRVSRQGHILKFVEDGRLSEAEQEERLLSYIDNIYRYYDFGIWGIFGKTDNELIGVISLDLLSNDGIYEYETGFFIRKERTGRGFGTEALEAVISYSAAQLRIARLVAVTDRSNEAAISLLLKCGFERMNRDCKRDSEKNVRFVKQLIYKA